MNFKSKKSFSILELSIVISVSAVLLGSSMMMMQGFSKYNKFKENQAKIDVIKKAIQHYFDVYNRLPCPADPRISISGSNYAAEVIDSTGGCSWDILKNESTRRLPEAFKVQEYYSYSGSNISSGYMLVGAVPALALGLDASYVTDAYGNKFTYFVHDVVASHNRSSDVRYVNIIGWARMNVINKSNDNQMAQISKSSSACNATSNIYLMGNQNNQFISYGLAFSPAFVPCNIIIRDSRTRQIITSNNIATVIISHGSNGYGAWNANGSYNAQAPGYIEQANSYRYYSFGTNNVNAAAYKFGNTIAPVELSAGARSNDFDDLVVWFSAEKLMTESDSSENWSKKVGCHASNNMKGVNYSIISNNAYGTSFSTQYISSANSTITLASGISNTTPPNDPYVAASYDIKVILPSGERNTCGAWGVWY